MKDQDAFERTIFNKKNALNTAIVIVNIAVFICVSLMGDTGDTELMIKMGAEYAPLIQQGQWYRLFTAMFLHFGVAHLAGNMIVLFFLGAYAQRYLGWLKYAVVYFGGGLLGNAFSYLMDLKNNDMGSVSAGASGAIFAVIGALLVIMLMNGKRLEDITLPQLILFIGLQVITTFTETNIDIAGHLGGFAGGAILALIISKVS